MLMPYLSKQCMPQHKSKTAMAQAGSPCMSKSGCILDVLGYPAAPSAVADDPLLQAQGAAGRIEDLEREANAANQEVVLLSDELEKRDGLIERLQQDLAAFSQQVKAQGSELKQHRELFAARYAFISNVCASLLDLQLEGM